MLLRRCRNERLWVVMRLCSTQDALLGQQLGSWIATELKKIPSHDFFEISKLAGHLFLGGCGIAAALRREESRNCVVNQSGSTCSPSRSRATGRFSSGSRMAWFATAGRRRMFSRMALLKAWTHRERLIDANALQSWLRTAVTREALQVCRRKRLEQQAASPGKLPSRKADEPPHHHVDLHDSIAAALEKLPEEVRTVVVLCKIEQVPGKEAARLLGISAVEVSRMLAYGLERLRDHLSDWR
jgi:RNA polymerase sigma factor (sigma-70 family)